MCGCTKFLLLESYHGSDPQTSLSLFTFTLLAPGRVLFPFPPMTSLRYCGMSPLFHQFKRALIVYLVSRLVCEVDVIDDESSHQVIMTTNALFHESKPTVSL